MAGFRLIQTWDAVRELTPEDFQYILRPEVAFERTRIFYDLDSDNYSHFSLQQMPKKKNGFINPFSSKYDRKRNGIYDGAYDHTQHNLDTGWFIGIDESERWDYFNNPFYFNEDGDLIYDCFMKHWHEWFEMMVRDAYHECLDNHQGRKPAPTQKLHYSDTPVQHTQAGNKINSKAAGWLLAAGGIYNGNVEDFRKTADQLGGDAVKGYDQALNEQTAGAAIAAASILLAKRPNNESFEEVYNYLGKVRGETKLLNNIEVKEINYIKRAPSETMLLRKEFNSTARKKFLNQLSNSSDAANSFESSDLLRMRKGIAPDGWEVHHKLPLDDSGTNTFDNLSLIKKEPFHKVLTNMQRTSTRDMQPGDSKITPWIMPTDSIYPLN
ncbi:HNH endonuclease signature motif containing protein [Enterobacter cloacae]|uniref:HNH endonuclease signature motif containing protein n=2 Tax=Enterobacter TaxID=547 RepID=UPI0028EFA0F9|nr:HNH endonuclease signature motif containing protein [Enterobacter cloacae]WNT38044.1 HNH endonuclease signature motif containing protein [Enterobacter cloacae]HDR2794162.1 HNH endonuclease [Enterobacter asburiae]HDR2799404.1 HNH endonuclease [Enterobacter asburiae]